MINMGVDGILAVSFSEGSVRLLADLFEESDVDWFLVNRRLSDESLKEYVFKTVAGETPAKEAISLIVIRILPFLYCLIKNYCNLHYIILNGGKQVTGTSQSAIGAVTAWRNPGIQRLYLRSAGGRLR